MRRKTGIRVAIRQSWFFWLCLLFFMSVPVHSQTERVVIDNHRLYTAGDSLNLAVELDSLFSRRALDAIESGMITSVVYEFRINRQNNSRFLDHSVLMRLEHDIWEGQYLVIRQSNTPDTLKTNQFSIAETYCSKISNISLGPLPAQPVNLYLQMRIAVNPISLEQERRTRNWLNVLQEGSLLELFITLDRPADRTKWIEIERFNTGDLR